MSELTPFNKAVIEFCYNILNTDLKSQLEDKTTSKEEKLLAIDKLKRYYVDNQKYEYAAYCREIEKQIEEL